MEGRRKEGEGGREGEREGKKRRSERDRDKRPRKFCNVTLCGFQVSLHSLNEGDSIKNQELKKLITKMHQWALENEVSFTPDFLSLLDSTPEGYWARTMNSLPPSMLEPGVGYGKRRCT